MKLEKGTVMKSINWTPLVACAAALWFVAGLAHGQQVCPAGHPLNTPNGDFADAGNGTVRHIPSGLIWKRCAEGQDWNGSTCTGTASTYDWQASLARVAAVNAAAVGTQNAGQTDWRLPNVNELLSIVELGCMSPSINLTQFPAAPGDYFWSSSPFALETIVGDRLHVWFVDFARGFSNPAYSSNNKRLRLVRAGDAHLDFDAAAGAPSLTSPALPNASVGSPYGYAVTAAGTAPITFSAAGLPAGLAIDPATGVISGVPTTPGIHSVDITASNAVAPATRNYALAVLAAPAAVPPQTIPTLSPWGLAMLSTLLAAGTLIARRRRPG